MIGRAGATDRLVEPLAVAFQHLIGGNDDSAWMARRHFFSFCPRKSCRGRFNRQTRLDGIALQRILVDFGLVENGSDPGCLEHSAPGGAARGQYDGFDRQPAHGLAPPSTDSLRRARILMTSAAVSSIERRVTSITGQPILV